MGSYCWFLITLSVTCLVDRGSPASCCQNGAEIPKSKEAWMDGVTELDQLHKLWLGRKILDSLNIRKVPENAYEWKRNVFNDSDTDPTFVSDAEEEVIRRYTLRVVGRKVGSVKRAIRHQFSNLNDTKCSVHYTFNSNLQQSTYYKTHLLSAAVETPEDAMITLHMNEDEEPNGNTIQVHHLAVDVVQGRRGVVQVAPLIFPFWSTVRGIRFSVTVRSRHLCSSADEDEFRTTPVLKLELRETKTPRPNKRQLYGSPADQRSKIVIDCEAAWDQAFLQNTSIFLFDAVIPCCRRRVTLDFVQLGWDNWVVAPLSFDSYYCIGRCSSFGGFATDNTDGASFYTEVMNIQRKAKASGLSACCSPVKFSPMTITVMIGANEQMTQTLEDVIVSQCGCM